MLDMLLENWCSAGCDIFAGQVDGEMGWGGVGQMLVEMLLGKWCWVGWGKCLSEMLLGEWGGVG